jgi:Enolase C-terminal domain-like
MTSLFPQVRYETLKSAHQRELSRICCAKIEVDGLGLHPYIVGGLPHQRARGPSGQGRKSRPVRSIHCFELRNTDCCATGIHQARRLSNHRAKLLELNVAIRNDRRTSQRSRRPPNAGLSRDQNARWIAGPQQRRGACQRVREMLGPDLVLLADAAQLIASPKASIRLARRIEEFDIGWYEESATESNPQSEAKGCCRYRYPCRHR